MEENRPKKLGFRETIKRKFFKKTNKDKYEIGESSAEYKSFNNGDLGETSAVKLTLSKNTSNKHNTVVTESKVTTDSAEENLEVRNKVSASEDSVQSSTQFDENHQENKTSRENPPEQIETVKKQQQQLNLCTEFQRLAKQGWYWGPITRIEAEEKMIGQPDGAFLVRDSSDDRYFLSLSFRSEGRTLHTRLECFLGGFSFYETQLGARPRRHIYDAIDDSSSSSSSSESDKATDEHAGDDDRCRSIVDLVNSSIEKSKRDGVFAYSRSRDHHGSVTHPVCLIHPVSRLKEVRSLQYLCRFVIRQLTRVDHLQKLPLPYPVQGFLAENQF